MMTERPRKQWIHPVDKTTYRAFPHENGPFDIDGERHRIFAEPASWYRNSGTYSKWEVLRDYRECDAAAVDALGATACPSGGPRT